MTAMTELFYRWHQNEAPPFSAENAWSADWGSEFTPDGSAYRAPSMLYYLCETCQDETGACGHEDEDECAECDCPGWTECERGYSCYDNAADLADYFGQRGCPTDDTGTVYVFEGVVVGAGTDGEPLAVPDRVVETLTWSELLKHADAEVGAP